MKKSFWIFGALVLFVLILGFGSFFFLNNNKTDYSPIKVGILHSLTGTMSASEKPVVDATMLAIEEINAKGGILGRKIIPVVYDGASNDATFMAGARALIVKERVQAIFGCWTSASRLAVKPVVENLQNILFYPAQYEGMEESSSIVYLGSSANQHLVPGASWCVQNLGKKCFMVGSDYIYPKAANTIMKSTISVFNGEIVGEEYIPFGAGEVESIIAKIQETKPDFILNTIYGSSNEAFFAKLRAAGITPQQIPTMSFGIGPVGAEAYDFLNTSEGDYSCWSYYQSLDNEQNKVFVELFRNKYGQERLISDPMESAFVGVHLWAQAVVKAESADPKMTKIAIKGQAYGAPAGLVYVEPKNNHLWKIVRIGQRQKDGQTKIIWDSAKPVKPRGYPFFEVSE